MKNLAMAVRCTRTVLVMVGAGLLACFFLFLVLI
jgi:hypothetical protein